MKQVLRLNEDSSISHILYCIIDGVGMYLTKEVNDSMIDFGQDEIDSYYSGEDHEEIVSLKEDIAKLLSGESSVEVMKFSIAQEIGYIESKDILQINGE